MTQPKESEEASRGAGTLFMFHLSLWLAYRLFDFLTVHFSAMFLFRILRLLSGAAMLALSLSQLTYAIPLYRRYKRQRRFAAAKGVLTGALVTVFVQGGLYFILGVMLFALISR